MVKGTPELLKIINKRTVLSLIINEQVISRAQIANKTNLSKSTISGIVDQLLSENIIKEIGEGVSTKLGGRKPIELVLNPTAGYILGIDIGAYKTLCVISDLSRHIVFKETLLNCKEHEDDILNIIIKTARKMLNEPAVKDRMLGIGIGIPGITDIDKGLAISVPKLKWQNLPIKKIFQDEFSLAVDIDNDVNMAALGEKWSGAGRDYNNFVFISIGDGIGSGIFIDNKIYRGSGFTAGEIGYQVLSHEAFETGGYTLDSYGYFESIASGSAIEKRMHVSCKEVFGQALQKDPFAWAAVDEMTDYLSMGIANLISVLNPDAIIVGGGVSKAGPQLLTALKAKIPRLTPVKCNIVLSELDDEAGVMGCIASILINTYGISFPNQN